jgi:hypothetical protein
VLSAGVVVVVTGWRLWKMRKPPTPRIKTRTTTATKIMGDIFVGGATGGAGMARAIGGVGVGFFGSTRAGAGIAGGA